MSGTNSNNTFNIRDLAVLGYANGITLWSYKPGLHAVFGSWDNPEYFIEAADIFFPGDCIMISHALGGSIRFAVTVTSIKRGASCDKVAVHKPY